MPRGNARLALAKTPIAMLGPLRGRVHAEGWDALAND